MSASKKPNSSAGPVKEVKPYLVFRTCAKRCLSCPECGYVYGPGHEDPSAHGRWPWWRTS